MFERLGGIEALRAAVSIFYGKLLVDVELKPFFEDVDMANLQAKQVCASVRLTMSSLVQAGNTALDHCTC